MASKNRRAARRAYVACERELSVHESRVSEYSEVLQRDYVMRRRDARRTEARATGGCGYADMSAPARAKARDLRALQAMQ